MTIKEILSTLRKEAEVSFYNYKVVLGDGEIDLYKDNQYIETYDKWEFSEWLQDNIK